MQKTHTESIIETNEVTLNEVPKGPTRAERKEQERKTAQLDKMVSRREALELVNASANSINQYNDEKLRMLFIQVKTLTNLVVEKGIATLEELDALSLPVMKDVYGGDLVDEAIKKKEEAVVAEE